MRAPSELHPHADRDVIAEAHEIGVRAPSSIWPSRPPVWRACASTTRHRVDFTASADKSSSGLRVALVTSGPTSG